MNLEYEIDELLLEFLQPKSANTALARNSDIRDFASHRNSATEVAVLDLISSGPLNAESIIGSYTRALVSHSSGATTNRRISSIRALLSMAKSSGLIAWHCKVPSVQSTAAKDMTGPSTEDVARMIDASRTPFEKAAIRLMYDLALRRAEISGIDIEHVDLDNAKLSVTRKAARKSIMSLPPETVLSIKALIGSRSSGPVFVHNSKRANGDDIYKAILVVGARVGIKVSPNRIRHSSISRALDIVSSERSVAGSFSGHKQLRSLLAYDDRGKDRDRGGDIASLVAADLDREGRTRALQIEFTTQEALDHFSDWLCANAVGDFTFRPDTSRTERVLVSEPKKPLPKKP